MKFFSSILAYLKRLGYLIQQVLDARPIQIKSKTDYEKI